jgi:hypothetical protein
MNRERTLKWMAVMTTTLDDYRATEREMAVREATAGFKIHAAITAAVCIGLVLLNVFVASEFPWSVFPVIGMSIGLLAHWYFGIRNGGRELVRHQQAVSDMAKRDA